MAKKLNVNDAAMQQKMRVLMKLRDSCIRSEKDLQGMTAETMLAVKDVNMDEMHIIVELQNSVKNGKLFSYLIEAQEILIPECVSGNAGKTEKTESAEGSSAWEEGDVYG